MPAGRPTLYAPELCEQVIDLGKLGKSITQIAAMLDVSRDTLYGWKEDHPEFSYALSRARELAQSWWEDQGQQGLLTPGFNASLWAKQVSCRFPDDYRDTSRQEHTGKDGKAIEHSVGLSAETQAFLDAMRS